MIDRKKMIGALKSLVEPELKRRGFNGKFPHFKRVRDSKTDLLSFQFDEYESLFVIEISQVASGEFLTSWGGRIPASKLTPFHLELRQRYRVQPHPGRDPDNWFKYGDGTYEATAASVLPFIEVIDLWFSNGVENPSIRLMDR